MYNRIKNISMVIFFALVVATYTSEAFGQNRTDLVQKVDYYTRLGQQWAKYRDQTVAPYYNDPRYRNWARSEYARADQQMANANRYRLMYLRELEMLTGEKAMKPGTETIIEECWVKVANGTCTMMYGRVVNYDDGSSDTSDYYNKRKRLADAGFSFAVARDYSRRRINEIKYSR